MYVIGAVKVPDAQFTVTVKWLRQLNKMRGQGGHKAQGWTLKKEDSVVREGGLAVTVIQQQQNTDKTAKYTKTNISTGTAEMCD